MSLTDAIKPVTAKWLARYRRSQLPAFFAWWKAELVGLLPAKWQDWFQDRRETWFVAIQDEVLSFRREGEAQPLATFPLAQQPDILRADVRQLLGHGPHPDRRLILAVPGRAVLLKSLQFPPAVEQDLRQVLSFEMDRQTPFKADQVYFDYLVEPVAGGKQLRVDLALAPRAELDALIERTRSLDLSLDGADVSAGPEGGPGRRGFNLLPAAARARRSNPQLRLNLILGASALLLAFMAMQQSIANREQALEGLRANVEAARAEARAVTALRNQLDTAVSGAGYLAARKAQTPTVLRVIGDLSERLPDQTWLERMTFREGGLEIAGQSDEATKLIALLQESLVISNPAFMGQITPDVRTRKERFTLSARYDLRPGADAAANSAGATGEAADSETATGEETAPADEKEAADADPASAG